LPIFKPVNGIENCFSGFNCNKILARKCMNYFNIIKTFAGNLLI